MHPRFGFLMMGLIALSFTHNRILAAVLFVLFCIELALRISIMFNKQRTNPYRSSLNQKIDALFLVLDFIGIASLLITILNIPLDAENLAATRLLRAVYLLRTLRMFRYIDLQSAMYSPTYGMLISLIILLSFFAQDTMMWVIIIFFSVELAIRFLIMRNIRFESRKDMIAEWLYWSVDLIATIVMIPAFAFVPYGGALRMLRLIRLLRPWMVIIRNLKDVMREGQFMQEINLIILLLAVLSIGGGIIGHFTMGDYDYDQNGLTNPEDKGMLAPIWFAFRMFTDPGNAIHYPNNTEIAVFTVVSAILGVFIFAFFIGIGASIVSGLMVKLRNERLNITNHMVMLGWSSVSPFILSQLKTISERSFSKLKLVVLNHTEVMPKELLEHSWVSYRWGNLEEVKSLQRINLAHARQAIVSIPEGQSAADNLALATFSLIAIRKVNPEIYLNYATPGMAYPHLSSHHHMLQIGWDTQGFYNKPTVVHSQADIRANMFRNILIYRDFDQVMERLMIPERTEESSLQVAEWGGKLDRVNGAIHLFLPDLSQSMEINALAARMLMRGVTLLALVDEHGKSTPLYQMNALDLPQEVSFLSGIAINANALNAETYYTVKKLHTLRLPEALPDTSDIKLIMHPKTLNLLITGWVGSLPLLLQRLLDEFDHIRVTLIDDLNPDELANQLTYLRRRCSETEGANERIRAEIISWNFTDMNFLRPYLEGVDRILLSRSHNMKAEAYASISTVLSHLITIIQEQGGNPDIFPIMENREQARVLQQELERFKLPLEIHVTVPDEFYGTYIAHTSFHMYASENDGSYELQRILRHSIDDIMGDVGDSDNMDLLALSVNKELPEDAEALFASLLQQGYVWIGYRLKESFVWSDPIQDRIRTLFPREDDFSCLRQFQIIINPFGNPVSRHSWTEYRQQIVELIVIGQ
ncbi:MAG: ion transporter, partial [Mariprofundaceae bacterium]|nr:ion transporter [Mariprofundaceae bacterium]